MIANFQPSLALVLQHEGGLVDDPHDPGGRTNRGVTQDVYNDWRRSEGLPIRDVAQLNGYETGAIYKSRYWDAVRGDQLPAGVDYAVFDFAVNSGTNRAARYLQRAAGVAEDGQIGPVTLAAIAKLSADAVIETICAARLNFLKQLKVFDRFGRGWTRRVEDVCTKAKEMAA